MGKIEYESIAIIKETEKGSIRLAAVEGHSLPVIVKLLKKGSPEVYECLRHIENKHIPRVYGYEETKEGLLVVEEYVDGETLSTYLGKNLLSEQSTLSIALQLCDALQVLHEQKPPLIHKDIKPSNIIITANGVVKIIDFDSSRIYKEDSDGDTRLLGTEQYAPPEQYGYAQTDTRSDIYSLGVVLGKLPGFAEKEKQSRWKKLLERCTLFAPESRYQSVEEIKQEIERLDSEKRRAGKQCRYWLGVVGILFLVAGGVFFFTRGKNDVSVEGKITPTESEPPVKEQETVWTNKVSRTDCLYDTPETGEDASVVWRQDATDSETTKQVKELILKENRWVLYYFRDRFPGEDLLFCTDFLDDKSICVDGVSIYFYATNEVVELDSEQYQILDGILHIPAKVLTSIPDGFYEMSLWMTYTTQPVKQKHSWMLYVADNDAMGEKLPVIMNNWHSYNPSCNELLHAAVRNDSAKRITGLCWNNMSEVDASLYRILYEGRAIEFTGELLEQVRKMGPIGEMYITLSDGTREVIYIESTD